MGTVMIELVTPALFLLSLALIWRSGSTSMGTGLAVVAVVEMAQTNTPTVPWMGTAILHGQAFLVFACVALLVVHIRLGELAAHRVWQTTSLAIIMAFLLVSKFDGAWKPEHRIWLASLAQFIIVGGFGQVIWRRFHVEGLARYGLTLAAFPVSSVIHSFLAYDIPSLWGASALAAFYYGVIFLTAIFLGERFLNDGTQSGRLEKSLSELQRGSDHRGLPGK